MISSYSQLLVQSCPSPLDGEAAVCVEFITQGTRRMRELLADLLAYTRVNVAENAVPDVVDLNAVFAIAVENCKAAIEANSAQVTADPLPFVPGYQPHFIQLLQNLISNGVKYRSESLPRIHVSAERSDGAWQLSVSDNGIGIDPEFHQTIFGVFKRLHGREIPGTGIGLAICKRVVDRMGGRIWVQSRVNEGTTIHCTIPVGAKGEHCE
jgi:light-regulated signal transduction histidine kinase (bacteriophytochrome)